MSETQTLKQNVSFGKKPGDSWRKREPPELPKATM